MKINNTKVDYNGSADALRRALWKQWSINLASAVGASLQAVKTLTVGVYGSGKGVLYIDDIRLYRSAPAVVQPTDAYFTGLLDEFRIIYNRALSAGEIRYLAGDR